MFSKEFTNECNNKVLIRLQSPDDHYEYTGYYNLLDGEMLDYYLEGEFPKFLSELKVRVNDSYLSDKLKEFNNGYELLGVTWYHSVSLHAKVIELDYN